MVAGAIWLPLGGALRKAIRLSVSALLLAGCAGATPNQSMMITEDTALISTVAKNYETKQVLLDEALMEAAKVTRAHGFRYFVVLGAADASAVVTRNIPGQTFIRQNNTPRAFGTTNLSGTYLPGATFTTPDQQVKEVRLGVDITIRMYRDGDIDPKRDGVWNSESISDQIANVH
jgi:hypothetical protein